MKLPFEFRRFIFLTASAIASAFALYYAMDPPTTPPAHGALHLVSTVLWNHFGAHGIQGWWIFLAALFIGIYLNLRR